MTGRRARSVGSCDKFREGHRGTNENPGTARGRDVATGPLCSRLHRDRAWTALRTRFGATQRRRAAQAPPATRARRGSEANAGNSRHASRRRRKIVRRPALGQVDSRSGRSPELARWDQEARRRARSQAGDVRLAWSGRGRRCGGSGKAPPWLPCFPARGRDEGRVRSSGNVDGGYDAGSPRRRTTAGRNGSRARYPARSRHPDGGRRALAERSKPRSREASGVADFRSRSGSQRVGPAGISYGCSVWGGLGSGIAGAAWSRVRDAITGGHRLIRSDAG
jgi:hypothetical protein